MCNVDGHFPTLRCAYRIPHTAVVPFPMRTPVRLILAALLLSLLGPASASAYFTAVPGVTCPRAARPSAGVAIGSCVVVIGLELDYASSSEDPVEQASSLLTFVFNGLLQTPSTI